MTDESTPAAQDVSTEAIAREQAIVDAIIRKKKAQSFSKRLFKRTREILWSLFTTTDTLEDKTILDAPKYFSDPAIFFIGKLTLFYNYQS